MKHSIVTVVLKSMLNWIKRKLQWTSLCAPCSQEALMSPVLDRQCTMLVDNVDEIISHMKQIGFKRFLVSEPPVSPTTSGMRRAMKFNIFDEDGIKFVQKKFREQFAALQKKYGDNVIIFPEMEILDTMTSEEIMD